MLVCGLQYGMNDSRLVDGQDSQKGFLFLLRLSPMQSQKGPMLAASNTLMQHTLTYARDAFGKPSVSPRVPGVEPCAVH